MNELTVLISETQMEDLVERLTKRLTATSADRRKPVTFSEAAKLLGVCRRTVERRVEEGQIRRVPHTAKQLIPISEIDRLLS